MSDPPERYPGELQALVDYWAEVAGFSQRVARAHALRYLATRRESEKLDE